VADVCRARLAFGSLAGLAACLRAVRADAPAVTVVRVRCGLGEGPAAAAAAAWAGFRAVVLLVRFGGGEARRRAPPKQALLRQKQSLVSLALARASAIGTLHRRHHQQSLLILGVS
jgi:hypothetical protein